MVAAAWSAAAAAARRAAKTASVSGPKLGSASHIPRRGLTSGADHPGGARKVNFWEEPMHPTRWKDGQFWIITLGGGGALFYGGYKYFNQDKDKNDKRDERAGRP